MEEKMRKVWVASTVTILTISFFPSIIELAPNSSATGTIYVDDEPGGSPPEDYTSIQAAVDAANPGDTVFVYAGVYNEDVEITESINLMGEGREITIVIGSGGSAVIYAHNADYINISGFTIKNGTLGISMASSNESCIKNNKAINNQYGIVISDCENTIIEENIAFNNSDYHGIHVKTSNKITIANNTCNLNSGTGIRIQDSQYSYVLNNTCSDNFAGITLDVLARNNLVRKNTIVSNNNYGIGIFADNNTLYNNIITSNIIGVKTNALVGETSSLINSSITNSSTFDIYMGYADNLILLNTSFNESKTYFKDIDSTLTTQWFVHINIIDYLGNPVQDVNVQIEDNLNGSNNITLLTDNEGFIKWIPVTEYIEQDNTGDTIGEKTYFTPHRIVAWNNTLVGYAYPEPYINESKIINIILYNGTIVEIDNNNWNTISIPRIQFDTNLDVVLQSIEGRYWSVQWYDASGINDHWKHYCYSKPSYMNDLKKLNHTMGLWIDIVDPEGTTLVVYGEQLTINQTIPLSLGWNFVGFPSSNNKLVSDSLNGIFYGNDVDAIWTYNSTTQEWIELGPSDYFEVGHGYWIHSKVEENWEIPV